MFQVDQFYLIFIILNLCVNVLVASQKVLTFAGTGEIGTADGHRLQATFHHPQGLAVDHQGRVFISDTYNNKIRMVDVDGQVVTVAGSGAQGCMDDHKDQATFASPMGIVISSRGHIFVADHDNNKIRRIDPQGVVFTFAGSGDKGFKDGQGTRAKFNLPQALAIDRDDNIYVADTGNHRIRKIDKRGMVSTLSGTDGTEWLTLIFGTAAKVHKPEGVTINSKNEVFVSESRKNRIRKISPYGEISVFAGSEISGNEDGQGTRARFTWPTQITVDQHDNLFLADSSNNVIKMITPQGKVTTYAGSGKYGFKDGDASTAKFKQITAIAIDKENNLYIADTFNNKIRIITPPDSSTFVGPSSSTVTTTTKTSYEMKREETKSNELSEFGPTSNIRIQVPLSSEHHSTRSSEYDETPYDPDHFGSETPVHIMHSNSMPTRRNKKKNIHFQEHGQSQSEKQNIQSPHLPHHEPSPLLNRDDFDDFDMLRK